MTSNIFKTVRKHFVLEDSPHTKFLSVRDGLNRAIWDEGDKLNPEVREGLLKISDEVVAQMAIPLDVSDVIFTGSLVGYMWSEDSDLDLHILVDFKESGYDPVILRKIFDNEKDLWNEHHEITVKGFPVELYIQDVDQPMHAQGIYSLTKDEWIQKPNKNIPKIDTENVEKKADDLARRIDSLQSMIDKKEYNRAHQAADKLKAKIMTMRRSGLEHEGLYSVENLAFKLLRRNGYLDKLRALKRKAYDMALTVKEEE